MRKEPGNMGRLMIQRKAEGKRIRGRSPTRWIDQITKLTRKPMHSLTTIAQDGNKWRETIQNETLATTFSTGN